MAIVKDIELLTLPELKDLIRSARCEMIFQEQKLIEYKNAWVVKTADFKVLDKVTDGKDIYMVLGIYNPMMLKGSYEYYGKLLNPAGLCVGNRVRLPKNIKKVKLDGTPVKKRVRRTNKEILAEK